MTTMQTDWMQLPKDYKKQSQCHAEQWAIPKKLQNMQDNAVLHCWIIMD